MYYNEDCQITQAHEREIGEWKGRTHSESFWCYSAGHTKKLGAEWLDHALLQNIVIGQRRGNRKKLATNQLKIVFAIKNDHDSILKTTNKDVNTITHSNLFIYQLKILLKETIYCVRRTLRK